MNLYTIDMKTKYGDGYLEYFKGKFLIDCYAKKFISSINRTDVLRTLTHGLLFSRKLKELLCNCDEFSFKDAVIINQDMRIVLSDDFYSVTYNNKIKLVDYEKSIITDDLSSNKIFIIRDNIPNNSMVVVDEIDNNLICFTDNFINLIESNNLDIEFDKFESYAFQKLVFNS